MADVCLTHLGQFVLLLRCEVHVAKQQCAVLYRSERCIRQTRSQREHTWCSKSEICLKSSFVRFPGSTPLTSRPKSTNFEGSALGGRGKGINSMVMVAARVSVIGACHRRTALSLGQSRSFHDNPGRYDSESHDARGVRVLCWLYACTNHPQTCMLIIMIYKTTPIY